MSIFIRLLDSPISSKGDDLQEIVRSIDCMRSSKLVYVYNPEKFSPLQGTPFAYWGKNLIKTFTQFKPLEDTFGKVIRGPEPLDMLKSLRLWLEVNPETIGPDKKWVSYAKGGEYKSYSPDVHMLIDYELHRDNIESFRRPGDHQFYFLPGITFTQRTSRRLSFRVMNAECLTSPKGPGIIPNNHEMLWYLMALGNSIIFQKIIELKVGAADAAARSYDLHILRDAPVPSPLKKVLDGIISNVEKALDITQSIASRDEMSRLYLLPIEFENSLKLSCEKTLTRKTEQIIELQNIQNYLDKIFLSLYEINDSELLDLVYVDKQNIDMSVDSILDQSNENEDDSRDEDVDIDGLESDQQLIERLLQWIVGTIYGRWDIRFALNLTKQPPFPKPFDPLPLCPPGMLIGSDRLPMRQEELTADYPLPIAWDGFLVDDPDHPRDILSAVERTLKLFWPGRLEEVEREACEILSIPDLRTWFRDPRGFFTYHTKRYSKSRRKAPIYWPLQSAKRSYTIWLYYPRLNSGSLYHAGREYADAKLKLETGRLVDWQRSLVTTSGSARKLQERKIASQEALVDELKDFVKALDKAALLELKPDLNDGVLLNVAPLHELVPWKEAGGAWDELVRGKYEWSSIGKQLRQKGLVKNTNKVKEAK